MTIVKRRGRPSKKDIEKDDEVQKIENHVKSNEEDEEVQKSDDKVENAEENVKTEDLQPENDIDESIKPTAKKSKTTDKDSENEEDKRESGEEEGNDEDNSGDDVDPKKVSKKPQSKEIKKSGGRGRPSRGEEKKTIYKEDSENEEGESGEEEISGDVEDNSGDDFDPKKVSKKPTPKKIKKSGGRGRPKKGEEKKTTYKEDSENEEGESGEEDISGDDEDNSGDDFDPKKSTSKKIKKSGGRGRPRKGEVKKEVAKKDGRGRPRKDEEDKGEKKKAKSPVPYLYDLSDPSDSEEDDGAKSDVSDDLNYRPYGDIRVKKRKISEGKKGEDSDEGDNWKPGKTLPGLKAKAPSAYMKAKAKKASGDGVDLPLKKRGRPPKKAKSADIQEDE